MTETPDRLEAPSTEAGRRLLSLLGDHAPWFVDGSRDAELAAIAAIEAEVERLRTAPETRGDDLLRFAREALLQVPYHRPVNADGPHREYTCPTCLSITRITERLGDHETFLAAALSPAAPETRGEAE